MMPVQHRRIQPRAPHRALRDDARQRVRQRHGQPNERREHDRHPDIVNRPCDAIYARADVGLGLQHAAADERLVGPVVVRDIQVAVERNRVGDRQVMWLVTGPRMGAVGDESPEHEDDNGLKGAARAARS